MVQAVRDTSRAALKRAALMALAVSLAACGKQPPAVTRLEVAIDSANNCSLEKQPVDCQEVAAAIKARYPTSKPRVDICVDKQTRAEAALEVMNSVGAAGFPVGEFACGKAASG
jgi:biopolymer transport protein ExbD